MITSVWQEKLELKEFWTVTSLSTRVNGNLGKAAQICTMHFPQQGSKSQFSKWLNESIFVAISLL